MSGERYLLDTNAIVALLRGSRPLSTRLEEAAWVGVSVLSQIEFLAFPNLPQKDREHFAGFLERVELVGLDRTQSALIDRIIQVRQEHRLKLPDAIIAATAIHYSAALITDDRQLGRIPSLAVVSVT